MSHHKLFGYIGTYTRGESKGIYRFKLDTEKGIITDIEVASSLQNPTYLAISKDNKYLYSVVKGGKQGGVAAFSILIAANEKSNNLALFLRDKETGKLKVLYSRIEVPEPVCVKFLHI